MPRARHLLGETLRAQQQTIAQLQTQMDDYEDYVELWAHEVKTPLALLALVLDNRRDTLPEAVGFKLDYARNRMQAFIDQMLYYARLRGARRDYRFERLTLRSCIDEVLDDYRPLLEEKGYVVENIDATIIAQRPKLAAYRPQMAENIAEALHLEPGRVSVKATTEEGLGFTGSKEGIAAHCVCLLERI